MKANRNFLGTEDQEAAVSTVIGAVLVFGLMSTGFLLWSVTTLPSWIEQNEKTRNDEVFTQFSRLQSGLDGLSITGDSGPVSATIPLGAQEVPVVQPAPSLGSVSVQPGSGFAAAFTNTFTHVQGQSISGPPQEVVNGDTLTGVTSFDALNFGLTTTGVNGADSAWVQVAVTDGTNTVTGVVTHLATGSGCADAGVQVRVTATYQTGNIYQQAECGFSPALSVHTVNLLESRYGFAGAMGRLSGEVDVVFTDGDSGGGASMAATVGTVYRTATGQPQFLGTGVATGAYSRTADGSNLLFQPLNLHYEDQYVIWESGGILLQQGNGGTVKGPPGFMLRVDGATATLAWTVVQMSGTGGIASSGTAAISLSHLGTDHLIFAADSGTITLATEYVLPWERFLNAEILSSALGADATVTTGAGTVELALTDTVVSEWIIDLRIIQARVDVA